MAKKAWRLFTPNDWDKEIEIDAEGIRVNVDYDDVDHSKAKRVAKQIVATPNNIAVLKEFVAEVEYYIGNPSAWDSYCDQMSNMLRKHIQAARAAIKASGEK